MRVQFYDKESSSYDTVKALRITVNDKTYSFESFEKGNNDSYYVFGGEVMHEFLRTLAGGKVRFVSIEIDHVNKSGESYTSVIDHVEHYELSELAKIAVRFEMSGLWDPNVTTDLNYNDDYYKASISENETYDASLYVTENFPEGGYLTDKRGFAKTIGELKQAMQILLLNADSELISDFKLDFDINSSPTEMTISIGDAHVVYTFDAVTEDSHDASDDNYFDQLLVECKMNNNDALEPFMEQVEALVYLVDDSFTRSTIGTDLLVTTVRVLELGEAKSTQVGPLDFIMAKKDADNICFFVVPSLG